MLAHCFLEKFQCGFLVSGLGHKAFQDLTFVIDGAPEVVPLAVDLHKNLVKVPLPEARSHPLDPAFSYLTGEHRTELMPPKPRRFVVYVDALLVKQILHVS